MKEKAEKFIVGLFVTAAIALALGMTLLICSSCDDVSDLEEGALLSEDGEELQRPVWPITIGYDGSITHEKLAGVIDGTQSWWNDQAGDEVVDVIGEDDSAFMTFEVNGIPATGADILDLQDEVELTQVRYDPYTYEIIGCHTILNYDLAYDEATMRIGARHAIGHCLRLADDPGPPVTVDLRSIMAKPMDPLGELTEHDNRIIHGE